jgi:hypothetical protein
MAVCIISLFFCFFLFYLLQQRLQDDLLERLAQQVLPC